MNAINKHPLGFRSINATTIKIAFYFLRYLTQKSDVYVHSTKTLVQKVTLSNVIQPNI